MKPKIDFYTKKRLKRKRKFLEKAIIKNERKFEINFNCRNQMIETFNLNLHFFKLKVFFSRQLTYVSILQFFNFYPTFILF